MYCILYTLKLDFMFICNHFSRKTIIVRDLNSPYGNRCDLSADLSAGIRGDHGYITDPLMSAHQILSRDIS